MKNKTNEDEVIRVIGLVKNIITETEKFGTGGIRPHSAILNGPLLDSITIANFATHGKQAPKKFVFSMFSNNTVFDLKNLLAKELGLTTDYVRIVRYTGQTDLADYENGRTFAEMKFKPNEQFNVYKKQMTSIQKAPLVLSDGSVSPEARKIFIEWFNMFSTDQKMSPEQAAEFVRSCTEDNCRADDPRIINLFNTHDKNKDGFIEVEEFVEFYRICSVNKADIVRQNIAAHNYRADLKKISEVQEASIKKEELPRFKISQNQ